MPMRVVLIPGKTATCPIDLSTARISCPNTFGVWEDRNGLRHDNRPRFAGQRLGHRPALIIVSRAWRGNWCGLLGWRGFTLGERPANSVRMELTQKEPGNASSRANAEGLEAGTMSSGPDTFWDMGNGRANYTPGMTYG